MYLMRTLYHSGGPRPSLQGVGKTSQAPNETAGKTWRVPRNQYKIFRTGGEREKPIKHLPSFPVSTVLGHREAWHAAVHGVAKSWAWLSDSRTTTLPPISRSVAKTRGLGNQDTGRIPLIKRTYPWCLQRSRSLARAMQSRALARQPAQLVLRAFC